MPTYRKKMSTRSRKPKSKGGVVSDSVKKYVKSVTKKALPEMKFVTSTLIPGTEPVLGLNGTVAGYQWLEFARPTQGPAVSQRNGNQINLQGYHSKITYFNTSTSTLFVRRLILGVNNGDTEAGTDSAELFTLNGTGISLTTAGNTLAVIQTPINTTQYRVYFDKTIKLAPVGSVDGTNTRMVNYFQKFGGKKITYESNNSGFLAQNFRFAELILVATSANDPNISGGLKLINFNRTYFTDP